MTDTDQKLEESVLKRMLETPPTPHKGKKKAARKALRVSDPHDPDQIANAP